MPVELCWRHPDRREVLLALYVQLRMTHAGGWSRLLICVEPDGHTWLSVQLARQATEEQAHAWAALFARRYLKNVARAELVARADSFDEIYNGGGVRAFLAEHVRELERAAETRTRWRRGET